MVLVDSSAVMALASPVDRFRAQALSAYASIKRQDVELVATSYVLIETHALLDRRLGREAVHGFMQDFAPLLRILWVDERLHNAGIDIWQQSTRRLSLVDAVSVAAMRQHRIAEIWTYDRDFDEQGCEVFG